MDALPQQRKPLNVRDSTINFADEDDIMELRASQQTERVNIAGDAHRLRRLALSDDR